MKHFNALWVPGLLLLVLVPLFTTHAELSVQNYNVSVIPVSREYPVTQLSTDSAPSNFTITNHTTSGISIGNIALAGINADEFVIDTHSCANTTMAAGASCSVPVMFHPLTRGTKHAELRIETDRSDTPVLTAFLSNSISSVVEARRRMPPVLSSINIPASMEAGTIPTITWTLEGYHAGYKTYAALFDCTGKAAGECGNNFGSQERFYPPNPLPPEELVYLTEPVEAPGEWTYRGAATRKYTYTWNYNSVPLTRADDSAWDANGTEIVMRIYQLEESDAARDAKSVSLLIPGSPDINYYDTSGRRIVTTITPAP